ncbi:af724416-380e-4b7f-9561-d406b960dbf8 [Sclerotinia trifoliorum]|uniref:Af724416-380e-4b7f-9561-d406b960dbf8 n=1 Tax=Sclerotinia trifoliorum TaxID=28548 RepID=A0A8H2ZRN8_9HELO|nr:af724416-380e-4b7f-9561-d406b960dbf8 [Sclerotinia trifoliorum]
MLKFGKHFYNTISNIMSSTYNNKEPESPLLLSMQLFDADRFLPSVEDVLEVKKIFFNAAKETRLPLEIIESIIDLAEYWPHATTSGFAIPGSRDNRPFDNPRKEITVRSGARTENQFLLRSLPIGYFPFRENKHDLPSQKHLEDETEFTKVEPKPWPSDEQIPQDATEEVIKQWAEVSLCRGQFPCRKIIFRIRSRDQGWGGVRADKGTYRGSYTWFDVGLERTYATRQDPHFRPYDYTQESSNEIVCGVQTIIPEVVQPNPDDVPENHRDSTATYPATFKHKLNPDTKVLQKNKTATAIPENHVITWRFNDNIHPESPEADKLEEQGRGRDTGNGEFVRNLRIGDVVTLWAKARYPGWANTIEDVSIEVYYAI